MIDSPSIDYTFTTISANVGMSKDEMQAFIEQQKTALKRCSTIEETATLIVLAVSALTSYMIGAMLNNYGGHMLE